MLRGCKMAECMSGVYGRKAFSGFTARVRGKANAWLADVWLNLPGKAQRGIGIQLETYVGQAFAARQEKLLE